MSRRRQGQHLYVIQSRSTGAVKIGRSGDPEARLRELQTGSPHALRLLAVYEGAGSREVAIHRRLERWRLKATGEWFHPDCLPELPDWMYERLPLEDGEWWRRR